MLWMSMPSGRLGATKLDGPVCMTADWEVELAGISMLLLGHEDNEETFK